MIDLAAAEIAGLLGIFVGHVVNQERQRQYHEIDEKKKNEILQRQLFEQQQQMIQKEIIAQQQQQQLQLQHRGQELKHVSMMQQQQGQQGNDQLVGTATDKLPDTQPNITFLPSTHPHQLVSSQMIDLNDLKLKMSQFEGLNQVLNDKIATFDTVVKTSLQRSELELDKMKASLQQKHGDLDNIKIQLAQKDHELNEIKARLVEKANVVAEKTNHTVLVPQSASNPEKDQNIDDIKQSLVLATQRLDQQQHYINVLVQQQQVLYQQNLQNQAHLAQTQPIQSQQVNIGSQHAQVPLQQRNQDWHASSSPHVQHAAQQQQQQQPQPHHSDQQQYYHQQQYLSQDQQPQQHQYQNQNQHDSSNE